MKKQIKLALVATLALGATSAFATNGDMMIGQGAKSRAMGGVGIAKSFATESSLANPASISSVKDMEATLSVTTFMPDVSFSSDAAAVANGAPAGSVNSQTSDSSLSVIPEVYYAARLSDELVLGLAVAGTAGMGVDYDDAAFGTQTDNGAFRMKTELSLLKVAVPVSYSFSNGLTLGLEGVMQYGSLQMSHMVSDGTGGYNLLDNGASTDIGYGVEAGLTYTTSGVTLGAVYKSKIAMTYDNTISSSVAAFGGAAQTGITSGDSLDQPQEIGLGVSYVMGTSTISADYKIIAWSDAAGYKDFGWDDQNVFALGYEYAPKGWALRAGYNYAKSPISEQDGNPATAGNAAYGNSIKNFFNLAGFPGIVESHFTLGGGMDLGDFRIDGALVYAPEVSNSYNTSGMTAAFIQGAGGSYAGQTSSADVKHSQMGVTIAGTYRF